MGLCWLLGNKSLGRARLEDAATDGRNHRKVFLMSQKNEGVPGKDPGRQGVGDICLFHRKQIFSSQPTCLPLSVHTD